MHPELFCTKDYAKIHMDIKFYCCFDVHASRGWCLCNVTAPRGQTNQLEQMVKNMLVWNNTAELCALELNHMLWADNSLFE